jgi:4-alpha-glucanotransferase
MRSASGAPPDNLNLEGQNWGLAGTNPVALEQRKFGFLPPDVAGLHALCRRRAGSIMCWAQAALSHSEGHERQQGTYCRFPFEALLAVAAQESVANGASLSARTSARCRRVFANTLADWGLWSYQVMMFEREGEGRFRAPEAYRSECAGDFQYPRSADFRRLGAITISR